MADQNSKEKIIQKAVEIFSSKGYHGASMRDIAGAAECSLPTLYYHYTSKNDLFEEIVLHEFRRIRERQQLKYRFDLAPEKSCTMVIKQMKALNPYEKAVFKMVMKVLLGLEGSAAVREKLLEWERERVADNRKILDPYLADAAIREDFAALCVRVTENMMEKIILLEEELPDHVIERQLSLLFRIVK